AGSQQKKPGGAMNADAAEITQALVQKHGEAARPRAERGVKQVLAMWRPEDGDEQALKKLVLENFAADEGARKTLLDRYQEAFEQISGHMLEIGRGLRSHTELEIGALLPIDHLFAAFAPGAHLEEDLFES